MKHNKRWAARVVPTLFAGVIFASCIPIADAASADTAPPESINLQLQTWTAIADARGILQEEFNKAGVKKVNLIAQSSGELLGAESAAVGGGTLAFAQRMVYPAFVQKANGIPAVIVWLSEASNRYRTPIFVSATNKNINTVADLEGKKFGSSRVSCYWSAPFEILNNAGIPLDSRIKQGRVRYENIESPAVAIQALLSGAKDATAGHLAANQFTAPYLQGKFRKIAGPADVGVYANYGGRVSYFAHRDFAAKYPNVVKAFLVSRERARDWTYDHVDEAAQIVSRALRIPEDVAKFQITHLGQWDFMAGEPDADRARYAIKEFQKWYVAHGDDILVDRQLSDAQIDEFIDGKFFAGGSHSIYSDRYSTY
ncbi:MAG: ABC transporter substrate-binding protein [Candidatus Accumulibacter sp.]|jgi:ABC-type nitrate/sulfonate/bicarbonate transport system substrate-binding protein|nr:ABC transporter substrate-binding protein [Accumulibacter sp.]